MWSGQTYEALFQGKLLNVQAQTPWIQCEVTVLPVHARLPVQTRGQERSHRSWCQEAYQMRGLVLQQLVELAGAEVNSKRLADRIALIF